MKANTSGRKRLKQPSLHDFPKRQKKDTTTTNVTLNDISQEVSTIRAGVIIKMTLKNFMCHSLLEVKFLDEKHNASVVIGQNGSGKSAILTALVVGLGGKAALTNRGTNVKGFVKAGRNSATIEITLNNSGVMAYRPNIFGESITVVRHFTASGSSSYKIKAHNGEIISTQSKELQNVTNHLNIQIDNPICILNQDTSRNFLSSNDPKHKFSLFMKATRLETLSSEYSSIYTNMRDSVRLFEEKRSNIQKMKEDLRKLKHKMDQHKSIKNLKDEKGPLQNELLWAKVRDAEVELEVQQKTVDSILRKCDGFKQNSSKRADTINSYKSSIKEMEQKISELKATIEIQSRPYNDAKSTLEKLMTLYQGKKREKNSLQTNITSKKQDVQVLEREIFNANDNKNKVEQEKSERAEAIENLEQKLKANDDILQTARNDIFQMKSDISRKEEDDNNLKDEIRKVDQSISKYQDELNSMKNESGNTLLLYGRHIPKVLQLIEKNRNKFQQLPRGPLGYHIKLKDKKWAVAAEGYIGPGLLSSFIVDNKHDNQLLLKIFNEVSPDNIPTIITSKFFNKAHDVSRNLVQAPSDCVSLFDILEIQDPVVTNCIIDESSVEGILLIPSDERAMNLLSSRENVPRNCTQGVTIKGDRYYPDPNYKTYCSDYHRAQYLQVDAREHLSHMENQIQVLKQKRQSIVSQYNQIKNEKNIQMSKQNELDTKIKRLMINRTNLRRQLDEIRSRPEPESTDVDVLENELTEVKKMMTEKTASLERIESELKELEVPIKETEVRIEELKKATRNLEERLPVLQEQIREKNIQIREMSTNDDFDKAKIADYEARYNQSQVTLVTKQAGLDHCLQQAANIGERLAEIRQVPEIMEKINSIERVIRQMQSDPEGLEQIVEKFTDLREKYEKASNILDAMNKNVTDLKTAAKIRRKHYQTTEDYFIGYIKHSFKKILEFRQFKGSLDIDVQGKKLELIVIPQQGTQGLTTTSNLSGGERSFSTVAFLYSLWQCMEFPFYFLDEFDVYMDKLNRSKVFDILLHHASTKPQLQFVFLTPQDISFLNKGVTILRLENPERYKA